MAKHDKFFNDVGNFLRRIPKPKPIKGPKPVSFKEFIGGINSVAKTATSPANNLFGSIGKGLSGNNMLLPLMIGGGVVLVVVLSRK
jgi:hypothetical protein